MNNSSDTIGNRTRNLPACSAVPEPTAPPGAPKYCINNANNVQSCVFIQHNKRFCVVCVCGCVFLLLLSVRAAHTLQKCRVPIYIFCSVDHTSRCNRVKKNQLDAQLILRIFRQLLHVSGVSRLIIRRYNRVYIIGTYYSFFSWLDWNSNPGRTTVI